MINLSWLDFALRHLPEGFIIILAGYAIAKKDINAKLYILSSVLLGVLNFAIKFLPISSVIHMVLSIVVAISILTMINRLKPLYAILSTIICFILTVMTEGINVFLLGQLFSLDMEKVFLEASPLVKNLYGLPSLLLFGLIVLIYFLISRKRRKNVNNTKNS